MEITIASNCLGLSSSYLTETCDLPSGLTHDNSPFFLTSDNIYVNLLAKSIGSGINSFVSFVAYPNINP